MSYNGWSNYETWNAALWMDNDEGSSNLCHDLAAEVFAETEEPPEPFTRAGNATYDLSDRLKELFDQDMAANPVQGWMADAINAYLSEVNWHEIAKHYIDDVEKEEVVE
jgi:hypothetical protein